MDRRGIAVIHLGIVLEVKRDRATIVQLNNHSNSGDAFDAAERPILHAQAALILQEHDAIAGGERPLSAAGPDCRFLAKLSGLAQLLAGHPIELLHLVARVAEDEAGSALPALL